MGFYERLSGSATLSAPAAAICDDVNKKFCENFDDGDLAGWSFNDPTKFSNVTPGLNGTSNKMRVLWPTTDSEVFGDNSFSSSFSNGQKFWWEWRIQFDSTYRFNPGGSNSEFKIIDIRGPGATDRILFAPQGHASGMMGLPRWYFMNDPEGAPPEMGKFFFEPNQTTVELEPGGTYHCIIELTNGNAENGAFRFWIGGTLVMSFTTVTVGSANPQTWNTTFVGGPAAGVGVGGNIAFYDQIRITTTDISP